MTVSVSLFGEYRKYAPEMEFRMDLPEGATPLTIAEKLKIPPSPSLWVLVDGKRSALDQTLHEGSKVFLFQPVGGG
ncbi:MAG: MoaD/ThiS family protein [Candidatus Aureabacteria bacterium]|nr:MoaD/ThiS family protein [Candidatus Auribacterota bacterium]